MAQANSSFPPVSKEDLQLQDNPAHPGDPAIILYREIDTDSAKSTETHFVRIKVFNDAGKKYGDVEIPYVQGRYKIGDIQARTVDRNGHSVDFTGTVYDRIVVRSRRLKITVKSFTLPNVRRGSIIEYSYRLHWHGRIPDAFKNPGSYRFDGTYAYPAAEWDVQQDLFVRRSHFVLRPCSRNANIAIRPLNLPDGAGAKHQPDGSVTMDLENIPAIQKEDYSPPEDAFTSRVLLFYVILFYSNESYWRDEASRESQDLKKFLSPSKAVKEEAARLASPKDGPEQQLRKLYERVQKIRYISYERARSKNERRKEDLKPNKNVGEVLTRGYGFANEINLLFLALAREAGFTAYPVRVTARNQGIFHEDVPDPDQLNAEVIEVLIKGKISYFDPATLYCPFGLLPWEETGAEGIQLDYFGPKLVKTPDLGPQASLIERKAQLSIDATGTLQGRLRVIFHLQEALTRKLEAVDQDEAGRRKELEDEVKTWVPHDATVKLVSSSGWDRSDTDLKAEFELKIPSFGTRAGQRQLFPVNIFETSWKNAFHGFRRETPVDFKHAYRINDDVLLDFGNNYKLESLPVRNSIQERFGAYELSAEKAGNTIHIKRTLMMAGYYFKVAFYPRLQDFFDFIRAQDEEQAILDRQEKPAD